MSIRKSVGVKVSIIMTVIVLAALCANSFLSYFQASASLKDQLNSSMLNQAKVNAALISKQIEIYKNNIGLTASRQRVQTLDWNQMKPVLITDSKKFGFFSMALAKTNGSMINIQGKTGNISDRKYFKLAMKGQVTCSDPIVSKVDGTLVLTVAAPIKDQSGNTIGVIIGAFNGQILSDLSKDVKASKSGYGFIVNSQGTVIGHKNEKLVISQDNAFNDEKKDSRLAGLAAVVKKMTSGESGVGEYYFNGDNHYIAYHPISGTTWSFATVGIESEIMGGITAIRNQEIIMTIVSIVVAAALCLLFIMIFITNPMKKALLMIQELSKGHLDGRLNIKAKDEIGKMSAAMNELADTLQYNILGSLKQIAAGDMNVKIESKDERDEITPVVKETAATVSSIVNETGRIIEAANEGILDERCDDTKYNGDWKMLAQKINALCDSISKPIAEVRQIVNNMSVNDFSIKVEGEFKGEFKKLTDDVNTVRDRLLSVQDVVNKVSVGDTSKLEEFKKIGKRSENDELIPALRSLMESVDGIINEVHHLTDEAVKGNIINARGKADKFEGGFRKIVEGFNGTLDAVAEPLNEILGQMGKLAVNDYTGSITGKYKGDFLNLTKAVDNVKENSVAAKNVIVKISNGDFSSLEFLKSVGKLSENDEINPALMRMIETIKQLLDDTKEIAESAAEGILNRHGDATKYSGEYAGIIHAVNSFLDAVENPVKQIKNVINEISDAKFGHTIDGVFKGEFKALVNSVNKTSMVLYEIIDNVSGAITHMANGDFSLNEIADYPGDLGAVSASLNAILNSLNELFGNVNSTAEQVAAGSSQVSQGSQQLSQGATVQASSVEELSASIVEIAEKTKQNAINAGNANKAVTEVKVNATDGSSQMGKMLKSMDEISESSNNISKIIKVIDDIAFQTNILALNAAVEAARAGQYGKGFAVVADEVRNLAAKSANAAKETNALIESTVAKIESGTEIASNTAKAFNGIVSGVNKAASLVSEITMASNEQATGISQVDTGLEQVSKVVQTNSATAEESAAASEELSSQAQMLKEQVSRFKLRRKK